MKAMQIMVGVGCTLMTAQSWAEPIDAALMRFGISGIDERAAFIAQCAHESARFSRLEEGLSYSAQRLREVWQSRFPDLRTADIYAHDPQKLANHVYADRMGNGPEASGDGWRFRGRGLLQATGREMYAWLSGVLGLPLIDRPEMLIEPGPAALSAGAIWVRKDCGRLLQIDGFDATTRAINGGMNGAAERRDLFAQMRRALMQQTDWRAHV